MNGLYTIIIIGAEQHLHDAGLVRTPQVATNGREQQLASYRCHRLQLGHRLLRILLSGTSQPHRFRG